MCILQTVSIIVIKELKEKRGIIMYQTLWNSINKQVKNSHASAAFLAASLIGWTTIGLLAGFRKNKTSSKILEAIAIFIYPIPYFLVALILQIVFAFILKWFPLQAVINTKGGFGPWIASVVKASSDI